MVDTQATASSADTERVIGFPIDLGGMTSRALRVGHGPDVVLLHGAGSRADRWTPCLPMLAEAGYRATAIDLPGHGFAEKRSDFAYTSIRMAELVTSYVRALGQPVTLIGTSLGGHIAAIIARDSPELVSNVILVGATGIVPREASTAGVVGDRSTEGVTRKLELLFTNKDFINQALIDEEVLINTSPGAEHALDAVMAYLKKGINDHLVGEALSEVNCPTMLMWGEDDAWIPLSIGEQIAALIPRAPFVVMADSGHAPYFERPEDFCAAVATFLDPGAMTTPGYQRI